MSDFIKDSKRNGNTYAIKTWDAQELDVDAQQYLMTFETWQQPSCLLNTQTHSSETQLFWHTVPVF